MTGFITGGFVPQKLRGTNSGDKLVHVVDWYATYCGLAGVDAEDTVVIGGAPRPIDGVDVWPLLTGQSATQPRAITPTTEVSAIDASSPKVWWKLLTLAGQSSYYDKDQKQHDGTDPCLAHGQPAPPQPGRTDPIVNGKCVVCNNTFPCLYDVLGDPNEKHNVAAAHPDVVTRLNASIVASNVMYAEKSLPDAMLNKYTKVAKDKWGGYSGPCYEKK